MQDPKYIEDRLRGLELWRAEMLPSLRQLCEAKDKHGRLLETLTESMTSISHRTGSLEHWRDRDAPRIEAASKADEFALLVANHLGGHAERKLSRRDRIITYSVGIVAVLALAAQVAQLFYP